MRSLRRQGCRAFFRWRDRRRPLDFEPWESISSPKAVRPASLATRPVTPSSFPSELRSELAACDGSESSCRTIWSPSARNPSSFDEEPRPSRRDGLDARPPWSRPFITTKRTQQARPTGVTSPPDLSSLGRDFPEPAISVEPISESEIRPEIQCLLVHGSERCRSTDRPGCSRQCHAHG